MKYALIILAFGITPLFAQTESETEKEIHNTIALLFDGMRKSDSSMVRSAFIANPGMRTTFTHRKTGKPMVHTGSLQEFIDAVGTPKEELWDERISNVIVHTDDNLAQVWMDYSFYIDDTFSHCGVNTIQLVRTEEGWKISDIADTRRKERCGK